MNSFLSTSSFAILLWKREAMRTLLLLLLALALPSLVEELCGEWTRASGESWKLFSLWENGEGKVKLTRVTLLGMGPRRNFLHRFFIMRVCKVGSQRLRGPFRRGMNLWIEGNRYHSRDEWIKTCSGAM